MSLSLARHTVAPSAAQIAAVSQTTLFSADCSASQLNQHWLLPVHGVVLHSVAFWRPPLFKLHVQQPGVQAMRSCNGSMLLIDIAAGFCSWWSRPSRAVARIKAATRLNPAFRPSRRRACFAFHGSRYLSARLLLHHEPDSAAVVILAQLSSLCVLLVKLVHVLLNRFCCFRRLCLVHVKDVRPWPLALLSFFAAPCSCKLRRIHLRRLTRSVEGSCCKHRRFEHDARCVPQTVIQSRAKTSAYDRSCLVCQSCAASVAYLSLRIVHARRTSGASTLNRLHALTRISCGCSTIRSKQSVSSTVSSLTRMISLHRTNSCSKPAIRKSVNNLALRGNRRFCVHSVGCLPCQTDPLGTYAPPTFDCRLATCRRMPWLHR